MDVSPPVSGVDVIAFLRARQIMLIYHPRTRTLQVDTPGAAATVIGRAS